MKWFWKKYDPPVEAPARKEAAPKPLESASVAEVQAVAIAALWDGRHISAEEAVARCTAWDTANYRPRSGVWTPTAFFDFCDLPKQPSGRLVDRVAAEARLEAANNEVKAARKAISKEKKK